MYRSWVVVRLCFRMPSLNMLSIRRVITAVSGGVDSAVAAYLLKLRGFDVVGVFMENWDVRDEKGVCSVLQDANDAEWVCRKLDISFVHANFVKDYWNYVFSFLLKDYQTGRTPNPDILCNRHIKFDKFYKYACEELDADAIATGHYALTTFGEYLEHYNPKMGVRLLQPKDKFKDQTFFLSQVPQSALQKTMFPLGKLTKKQVKNIAQTVGMSYLVSKKESKGICFIGRRNFKDFISEYINERPGNFMDIDTGKIVGQHCGLHQWTVGQRCRIGGQPKPYFIARKDPATNNIYVAAGTDHASLYVQYFFAKEPHWIHSVPQVLRHNGILDCEFRFQHTKPLRACQVVISSEDEMLIRLTEPLRAITVGQYAVFYKEGECLGSGQISQLGPTLYSLGRQNCVSNGKPRKANNT